MESTDPWPLRPGDRIRRRELHDRFGGQRQSGISPSAATPNIFIFTGKSGRTHGYIFDGWADDGTFHYTGEGRSGDQRLERGNQAILNHKADGRALRLFEMDDDSTVVYMGEFELPNDSHVLQDEAPDDAELPRSVFVFRLRPVGETWSRRTQLAPVSRHQMAVEVPVEASNVSDYVSQREQTETQVSLRAEALLVQRYSAWLARQRLTVVRHEIVTAAGDRMYTDLFVVERRELIEAKGASSRTHIRMALGQILDYERYIEDCRSLAVLTPTKPPEEMIELLVSHRVASIWEARQGWFDSRRPFPEPTLGAPKRTSA